MHTGTETHARDDGGAQSEWARARPRMAHRHSNRQHSSTQAVATLSLMSPARLGSYATDSAVVAAAAAASLCNDCVCMYFIYMKYTTVVYRLYICCIYRTRMYICRRSLYLHVEEGVDVGADGVRAEGLHAELDARRHAHEDDAAAAQVQGRHAATTTESQKVRRAHSRCSLLPSVHDVPW
jgi:hypothetical protein